MKGEVDILANFPIDTSLKKKTHSAMVTRGRVDSDSMGAGCDWIRHHSHCGQVPPSQTAKQTKRRITFYSPPHHGIVICPEQWPGSWRESKLLTIAPTKRAGIGLILGWTFFLSWVEQLEEKNYLGLINLINFTNFTWFYVIFA